MAFALSFQISRDFVKKVKSKFSHHVLWVILFWKFLKQVFVKIIVKPNEIVIFLVLMAAQIEPSQWENNMKRMALAMVGTENIHK